LVGIVLEWERRRLRRIGKHFGGYDFDSSAESENSSPSIRLGSPHSRPESVKSDFLAFESGSRSFSDLDGGDYPGG